ncbi:MAG: DUF5606 domain-containing protein [Alloprevotella sp.]|nr:DUF5606 domain-containing protein [Alloprevotella sp.]
MKDTILSISGRPGLFRLVSRGNGNIIVETIDAEKKRFAVGQRDRVTSLNDITMYSDDDNVELMKVFKNICDQYEGKTVDMNHKTATKEELDKFMTDALPSYDRDRVHASDVRKLLQWYNILVANGYSDFEDGEKTEG